MNTIKNKLGIVAAIGAATTLALATQASAANVPITNYYWYRQVFTWTAAFDSLPIELNGTTYQTGQITMSLDPAYPLTDSYEIYDFRNMSAHNEYRLLVDAPLFTSLGAGPQHFHMVTNGAPGSITVLPSEIDDTDWTTIDVDYASPLSTIGTFDDGQLFSGWVYNNCKSDPPPTPAQPNPGTTIRDAIRERERALEEINIQDARLTDPAGNTHVVTVTAGSGRVELGPLPEPATGVLLAIGLSAASLLRKRYINRT